VRAVRRNVGLIALPLLVVVGLSACLFGSLDSLDSEYRDASAPPDAGRGRNDATIDAPRVDGMRAEATLDGAGDVAPDCGTLPDCAMGCPIAGNGSPPTALFVDDGGVFFASQVNGTVAIFAANSDNCQLPVQVLSDMDAGGEAISDLGADDVSLFWILRSSKGSRLFRAPRPVGGAPLNDPHAIANVAATLGPLVVGDLVYVAYYPAPVDGGPASPGIYAFSKDGGLSGEGPAGSACQLGGLPVEQMSYRAETLYWTLGATDDRGLVQRWSQAPGCADETDDSPTPLPFGIVATTTGLFWLEEAPSGDGGIFTPRDGGPPRRVLPLNTAALHINMGNVRASPPGYLAADDQFFYWNLTNSGQVSYAARSDASTVEPLFDGSNVLVAPIYSVGPYVYLATQGGVVKVNRPSP